MKRRSQFHRRAWILAVGLLLLGANVATAQPGQGIYVTQASARLSKLIDAGNGAGYKLDNNSFSIGGGWLVQSTDKWVTIYTVPLQSGRSYRFVAAGDDDARDVDVQVVDPAGKVVKEDTSTAPEAVVDFQPEQTQNYQVRVRLYASRENQPCVCLAILLSK